MHRRVLGFGSTLAFLFVGYAIAWVIDRHGVHSILRIPDSVVFTLQAVTLALVFTSIVLFVIIWPQTLIASWAVRRFSVHRFVPYLIFFGMSSIAVSLSLFLGSGAGKLVVYLWGMVYLLIPCSVLWQISFKNRETA